MSDPYRLKRWPYNDRPRVSVIAGERRFKVAWCRRHPEAKEADVMKKFDLSRRRARVIMKEARETN